MSLYAHMEYASVLKHPKRPDFLKGMLTQESPSVFVSHLRQCRPLMTPAEPPRGKFRLTGCPECSNASAVLYLTTFLSRFKILFNNTQDELRSAQADLAKATSDRVKPHYYTAMAETRTAYDPRWLPEGGADVIRRHFSLDYEDSDKPEGWANLREGETLNFLLELWKDVYGELFETEGFGSTQSNYGHLCLCDCEYLEVIIPRAILERTPLKVFKIERADHALLRISAKEKSSLEAAAVSRQNGELMALGVFDETLEEDSFPEMWPLAIELLRNDASMSINQAVLSSRLLASPEL